MSNRNPYFLRSLAFNVAFGAWAFVSAILFAPLFILSKEQSLRAGPAWAKVSLWLLKKICRIDHEIRGQEHITYGPVIYACKHQSAWDTVIFFALFRKPVYILKRSLLMIPGWGWYLWRMGMIAINRSAGTSSIKHMVRQSKEALYAQRPIIIFPEGTRTTPGAESTYHPGVVALYSMLHVPVVPIALNSGVYWGKNAFFKHPGRIVMEFLPPIEPGLEKGEFSTQLKESIESASQKLLEAAKVTT